MSDDEARVCKVNEEELGVGWYWACAEGETPQPRKGVARGEDGLRSIGDALGGMV